eukprot:c26872_g1_i1 orf=526-1824(-)
MDTLSFPALGSPRRFTFVGSYCDSANPSTASTPFVSAPSSPGRNGQMHGFFFSAPTSPSWATRMQFQETLYGSTEAMALVPFSWEEKPGTPRRELETNDKEEAGPNSLTGSDFEFSARFSEFEELPMSPTPMSTANELFFNGQILPLRVPPRLEQPLSVRELMAAEFQQESCFCSTKSASGPISVPQSPCSPLKHGQLNHMKGSFCGISNPAQQVVDPFAVAIEEMVKGETENRHRRTRSFSPLRIFHLDEQPSKSSDRQGLQSTSTSNDEKDASKYSKRSSPKTSKRWTLKSLLRRSRGEGRPQTGESSGRWTELPVREMRSSRGSGRSDGSLSSSDSLSRERDSARSSVEVKSSAGAINGTAWGINGRRKLPKGTASPHELHYTMQRAQTEELKKKTFLPYRQGLLGCLGISSKSYRAVATISKTLQPIS